MKVTLETYEKSDRKKLKKLYLTAFPVEERAPFFLMMLKTRQGRSEMLTAKVNGKFVGFVYMVCHGDLAYIFYLAVADKLRGKGIGGKIIAAVKERYRGRRIFLARERLDESAGNYAQRVSRRNFYLRCGFSDLPCMIKEASVVYDVMGIGGSISAEEYDRLITAWAGRLMRKLVDMRIIENGEENVN